MKKILLLSLALILAISASNALACEGKNTTGNKEKQTSLADKNIKNTSARAQLKIDNHQTFNNTSSHGRTSMLKEKTNK